MNSIENTFIEKLYECNLHKQRIEVAVSKVKAIMPLDMKIYDKLSPEQLSFIDQIIFRFAKLQDTLGDKVISGLLILLGEEVKTKSVIDRLNRLEELQILNKDEWLMLLQCRNEAAHEYSFNKDEIVEGINLIYQYLPQLLQIYRNIYQYCVLKFDFIQKSEVLK